MNPELQNYIRQARSMGKSNEVITQELSSNGWSPSDISQALGLGSGSPMSATASVVAGGMSGKIIAGIIVALIILGAGGYFVYSKNLFLKTPSITTEDNQNNYNQVSNTPTTNQSQFEAYFRCKDLLSPDDFTKITGEAFDEKIVDEKYTIQYQGFMVCTVGNIYIRVRPERSYSYETYWKIQKETAIKQENPNYKYEEVSGIGSEAYLSGANQLSAVSSNKKYLFDVDSSKYDVKGIAKIIDTKLNKY